MTCRLLGTRIFDLGSCGQRPTYLVSDLHVPADGGEVASALGRVLATARQQQAHVFVLGDLFDSYVSPAQLRVGIWRDVAAQFALAVQAGVQLSFLHGNRDFLLGGEFVRATSGRVIAGGIQCQIGGRRALLLHGDELCQNDRPYQRAKRWLRSWPMRTFLRRLPLRAALGIAERARRRSRMVVASGDQTRFDPTAAAVSAAFATGAELLVFGHIHRPARGRIGAGEYCVLPAFDATSTGICIDGGALNYVQWSGAGPVVQPDPPARTFA